MSVSPLAPPSTGPAAVPESRVAKSMSRFARRCCLIGLSMTRAQAALEAHGRATA